MKTFFQRPAKLILKDLFLSILVVSIIIGLDRLALTYFENTPNEMTLGNCVLENCETPFSITGINHFYVSSKGQDNSTCDFNNPCLTFSHAEPLAKPGDTIHLTGFLGNITVKISGAPAAPINIVGEDVILSGLAVDGNYINVYNVEVTGAISHGIIVNGKHVLIQDSIVHHSVTENGINSECDTSGYWGSGIKARIGAEHVTFRGNIVFDNCGEGFGITRAVHVLLEDNIVRSNFSVGIYIDNSNHVILKNNTVICDDTYLRNGNRMSGIVLAAEIYEGWGMQLHDVSVLNNKVDSCYDNITSWLTDDNSPSINLTIDGNISTDSVRRSIAIYSINQNVIVSNNIIDKPIYVAEEVINLGGLELIDNIVNTP